MRQRLAAARLPRREAEDRLKAAGHATIPMITSGKLERLGIKIHAALATNDRTARKAYLWLYVDQVVVTDTETCPRGPTAPPAKAASVCESRPAVAMVPVLLGGGVG
jgi:hypothetical protein